MEMKKIMETKFGKRNKTMDTNMNTMMKVTGMVMITMNHPLLNTRKKRKLTLIPQELSLSLLILKRRNKNLKKK